MWQIRAVLGNRRAGAHATPAARISTQYRQQGSTVSRVVARSRVAGVDGCRAGWVVVTTDASGGDARVEVVPWGAFGTLVDRTLVDNGWAALAVDMPIGLAAADRRACDGEARRRLAARRASVFPAPVRDTLGSLSYQDAAARSRAASGRSLAIQAFNLLGPIAAIDAVLTPSRQAPAGPVGEAHPELAFAHLLGRAASHPKRVPAGVAERLGALRPVVPAVDDLLARRPSGVAVHDLLDACALTWTARRMAAGAAERLGDGARDRRGLRMDIWC